MSCCTPDHSCSTGAAPTGNTVVADSRTTVYADSVLTVGVEVAAGRISVTTAGEPDDALIARTVDEAGYELNGRA